MIFNGQVEDLRACDHARSGRATGSARRVVSAGRALGAGLFVVLAAGCAGSDSSSDTNGNNGEGQITHQGPQCDYTGLTAVQSQAQLNVRQQVLSFVAKTTADDSSSAPFDEVLIRSYQGSTDAGPTGPGSYSLFGSTYKDCTLCVIGLRGCGPDGNCEKYFFADRGFVEIDSLSGAGSTMSGTLHGVEMSEVSWDSSEGDFVAVDKPELWCADGWSFSAPVEEKKASPSCVADGTGTGLGDNVADFSVLTCAGQKFQLHSKCGEGKALWMIAVAGWCPACNEAVPQVAQAYDEYHAQGLDVMVMLGEDDNYQQPTVEYCLQYAESHQIDPALVYIDWGSEYGSFQTMFSNMNPYTSTLGLPYSAVLRPSNMEYYYTDGAGEGDLNTSINDLMNQ